MGSLATTRGPSRHGGSSRPCQRGFTLIEVVVVISVITVLMSLILPAVMRARESVRRTQCMNNLRQVGIALQAFESTHQHYPYAFGRGRGFVRSYSPLAELLPHLEEDAVYNAINFSKVDPETAGGGGEWREVERARARFGRVRIDVFLCPSDPYARGPEFGGTNYRINLGTHATWGCEPFLEDPPDPKGGDGFFYGTISRNPSIGGRGGAMRDGLSNTVALAERLVGSAAAGLYPEGNYFSADPSEANGGCWSRENWIRRCQAITRDSPVVTTMGHGWLYSDYESTNYNHILAPNSPVPDCGALYHGVVTSRSWHRGGVNVSMGDAQARFISEEIDIEVWRALGTRASGDIVDADAF